MSGIKTIAVAGVGTIGTDIVEELLQAQAAGEVSGVIMLTRKVGGNLIIDALDDAEIDP